MRWKPILVGIDGSPESLRAARLGWQLAEAAGTACYFLHAVRAPGLASAAATGRTPPTQLRHDAQREIRAKLRGVVPAAALERVHAQVGRAALALADEAARRAAGLVLLGGKRRGAVARGVAGSTAHYLVRRLKIPVLVTGPLVAPIQRVLAAVDLSHASRLTLRTADQVAAALQARVRALHVLEPVRLGLDARIALRQAQYDRKTRDAFPHFVRAMVTGSPAEAVIRRGPATDTVIAEARRWKAGLVVVGSQGKGWVDRLLIGSTTERLLDVLPAAILVVPVSAPS